MQVAICDLPIILTSDKVLTSPVVLLDPENMDGRRNFDAMDIRAEISVIFHLNAPGYRPPS